MLKTFIFFNILCYAIANECTILYVPPPIERTLLSVISWTFKEHKRMMFPLFFYTMTNILMMNNQKNLSYRSKCIILEWLG